MGPYVAFAAPDFEAAGPPVAFAAPGLDVGAPLERVSKM